MDGVDTSITNLENSTTSNTNSIDAILNNYGSKNLLNIIERGEYLYGVTITHNEDGSIVLNGTPTGDSLAINLYCEVISPQSGLIYSGINGGSSNTYYINVKYSDETWDDDLYDGEKKCKKNLTITRYTIIVSEGYTCNNLTFYPMIRDARIIDPTYVPYAMTNKELSDIMSFKEKYSSYITQNNTWHSGINESCCCLVSLQGYDTYASGLILAQKFITGQSTVTKITGADHFNVDFINGELCCTTDAYSQGTFSIYNLRKM